jgi:beta-lactamase regulating signal transducer with metallopeptidase domain
MDAIAMRLAAASVQGGVVILAVWVVCRWSGIPARARVWLWWGASLRLCLGLLALPAVSVPLLPSPAGAIEGTAPALDLSAAPIAPVVEGIAPAVAAARRLERATPLVSGVVVLWAGVLLMHVVSLRRARRRLRGVRAAATGAGETLCLEAQALSRATGLRAVPELRISDEIESPQVVGIFHPCVLLPSAVLGFPAPERRMAMCHELMHVRRRDLPLGWIPALAERLFFFHPLARLAAREYLLAREAACDAAVVRLLHLAPADYARLLVRLGLSQRAFTLAVSAASPTTSALRRRLEMLHQPVVSTRSRLGLSMAVLVAALAWVPVEVTTRTVHAGSPAAAQEGPRAAESAEAVLVRSESPFAPAGSRAQSETLPEARFAARARASAEASAQDPNALARALEQEARARAQAEARAQSEAKLAREVAATQEGIERVASGLRQLAAAPVKDALAQTQAAAQNDEANQALRDRSTETARRLREILASLEAAQKATQPRDDELDSTWRQLQERRRELAAKFTERHPQRIALEQRLRDLETRRHDMEAMRAELEARRAALEVFEQRLAEETRRYRQAAESALERAPEPAAKD